ncbi:PREDICTED: formin-like protein 5-like [Chrysochloris asiatica]|uniref:Formin-like protein 5-like n=1 Tax=Chrysochloris asiatica TaxID=185453 RepID=A0A9B0TUK9_CHRAS|nr:PREDICTED: formin-like protein 5-like [Chrysochloris asiatica]
MPCIYNSLLLSNSLKELFDVKTYGLYKSTSQEPRPSAPPSPRDAPVPSRPPPHTHPGTFLGVARLILSRGRATSPVDPGGLRSAAPPRRSQAEAPPGPAHPRGSEHPHPRLPFGGRPSNPRSRQPPTNDPVT